jgi:hypothetical protein
MRLASVFLAVVLAACAAATDIEVLGCGGFIRPSAALSAADSKPNMASIKVQLLSRDNFVRDEMPCAPNGYFFFELADRGEFSVAVKQSSGWNVEPVSGYTLANVQACEGRDLNFSLTGFSVSGTVTAHGISQGPSGVSISLTSSAGTPIASGMTGPGGAFTLPNIPTGVYSLTASHPKWQLLTSTLPVTIAADSVNLKQTLVIAGFQLTFRAESGGEAMSGVTFSLSPKSPASRPAFLKCKSEGGAWCSAVTGSSGSAVFADIPVGTYIVSADYTFGDTAFEIVPRRTEIVVAPADLVHPTAFNVVGFAVVGHVLGSNGAAVGGVRLFIDGKERAVSNDRGEYTIDRVTTGNYVFEAVKANYFFEPLVDIKLSPAHPTAPTISVSGHHLCGKVAISDFSVRPIKLLRASGAEVQRTTTDAGGQFCFKVKPDVYDVVPVVTSEEENAGVSLSPRSFRVDATAEPVLSVIFSQGSVSVAGRVECLVKPCDSIVSVSLAPVTRGSHRPTLTQSLASGDVFSFEGVSPGQYTVSIVHDDWCWNEASHTINVGIDDIVGITFKQSGYSVSMFSSRPVELHFTAVDNSQVTQTFQVKSGLSVSCLARPGVYAILPESCYKFDMGRLRYDTASPRQVQLSVSHVRIRGSIQLPPSEVAVPVAVQVLAGELGSQRWEDVSIPLERATASSGLSTFVYWAPIVDNPPVVIRPFASDLFFYPPNRTLSLADTACPTEVLSFVGRVGWYLTGNVSANIADVEITGLPPTPSTPSALAFILLIFIAVVDATSGSVVATVMTQADGTFKVGPLYDDRKYVCSAKKSGFHFQEVSSGLFKSVRLGSLEVEVTDESGAALPNVLLSISGDNYRKNSLTSPAGSLVLPELFPGEFFLRVALKEYQFTPASLSFLISEGGTKSVKIQAKRVSYSVFGSVSYLSGAPVPNFVVDALQADAAGALSRVEEATVEESGNFRLRGLASGQTYVIAVRANTAQGDGSWVERLTVAMEARDARDMNFVVLVPPTQRQIVRGTVDMPAGAAKARVVLKRNSDGAAVTSADLSIFNMFEFNNVAEGS